MKKTLIIFGAIAIVLLMVSSAIAIPTANNQSITKTINKIEKTSLDIREEININGPPDRPDDLCAILANISACFTGLAFLFAPIPPLSIAFLAMSVSTVAFAVACGC